MKIEKLIFAFVAAVTLLFVCFFSVCAFAQNDVFLKPIANENCPLYLNATSVDGVAAPMPDVDSTKHYSIFFDLGYTNPANAPMDYKIYGDFPPGSKVYLAAVIDEQNEGYSHRWIFVNQGRSDNESGVNYITHAVCPFPYRHVALLRFAEWSSSCPSCNPPYFARPDMTNGKTAYIDALSMTPQKKPMANSWQYPYSRFVINNSVFKTIK